MLADDPPTPASRSRASEPTGRAVRGAARPAPRRRRAGARSDRGLAGRCRRGRRGGTWRKVTDRVGRLSNGGERHFGLGGHGRSLRACRPGPRHDPGDDVVGDEAQRRRDAHAARGALEPARGERRGEGRAVARVELARARADRGRRGRARSRAAAPASRSRRARESGGLGLRRVAARSALERRRPALERVVVAVAHAAPQSVRRGPEPDVVAAQPVDQVVPASAPGRAEVRGLVGREPRRAEPRAPASA